VLETPRKTLPEPIRSLTHRYKGLSAYGSKKLIRKNAPRFRTQCKGTRSSLREETTIAATMLGRVMARFGMMPQRLAGDTAYGTGRLLKWLVDRGVTPHVPVWDRSARVDGKFSKADFTFDRERNVNICPAGKEHTLRRH
jgi:hypothetical protein